MKRVLLITALALGFTGFAMAQQTTPAPAQPVVPAGKHHAPNAHKEAAKMTKELNLTPDQAARIEPILSDRDAKLAAIKEDASLTTDQSQKKMKDLRKSTSTQLRAILTAEQASQMDLAKKGKKHTSPEESSPNTPPPPPTN